jgi:hypothetical protein
MFKTDFDDFEALLNSTAQLMGKPAPQGAQVAMFFRVMQRYSIDVVREALEAHLRDSQRGRFFPMPADLIAQIEGRMDTRPTSDEAWAISIKALDEFDSVVWTDEMAEAWGICKPIIDMGDEVGARMAFKAAYDRLVMKSRETGVEAKWAVSLGFDVNKRAVALEKAQKAGRIQEIPAHMRLEAQSSSPQLEYQAERKMPPDVRQLLHELLNKKSPDNWYERGEEERKKLAERKKNVLERINEFNLLDNNQDA